MDRRTWKRFVVTLLGMVALLAAGVLTVFLTVSTFSFETRAARNEGVLGTFTAKEEHCQRASCSWHGAFASADGQETRDDTVMHGLSFSVVPGDRVPAIDVGDGAEVYHPGRFDYGLPVMMVLTTLAWAGLAVWPGRRALEIWRTRSLTPSG
ncbi:hypothetical protein [Nonomuraea roseoviolacea]|uniref:DUF3592 domain-containing protein n=1 Tax=Nonomuraea roseoviolacea subsp. carminata TaxID=160689 RepID=A0ABT1K459_9ACTN|nr:hypothetical protein [Nonomuraea roseoviolacea]MCP2348788.1 hypothetical protein [Nonomuraea roseoviolacea subsp. carminata]